MIKTLPNLIRNSHFETFRIHSLNKVVIDFTIDDGVIVQLQMILVPHLFEAIVKFSTNVMSKNAQPDTQNQDFKKTKYVQKCKKIVKSFQVINCLNSNISHHLKVNLHLPAR